MNIGIVSSWVDTLVLFKFLTRYDNNYFVYCDQEYFPYWEKSLDCVLNRIKSIGEFLKSKWADIIIIDPVYELALKHKIENVWFDVLPLFQRYLHEYAFKYSLVGKIWVLSDFWSVKNVQNFFEMEEKNYILSDEQKSIKKFSYPFHYWIKPMSSWTKNINDLWVHNPFLIRTMKNDLRYFKDAYVDTILPMHYNYFYMQRAIKSFFNFRKIRFHDFSVIEKCFDELVKKESTEYWISVWINQPSDFIVRYKHLMWLMQRWKSIKLDVKEI